MDDFEFIARYDIAETKKQKFMCWIAKVLGAHYVTAIGRIMLLPDDYHMLVDVYGVSIPW